jgi:hypothetical protein
MDGTLKNSGAAKSQGESYLAVREGGNCLKEKSKSCLVQGPWISFELHSGSNPLRTAPINEKILTGLDKSDGFDQPSGKSRFCTVGVGVGVGTAR